MQRVRGLGSMDDGGPVAILRGLGASLRGDDAWHSRVRAIHIRGAAKAYDAAKQEITAGRCMGGLDRLLDAVLAHGKAVAHRESGVERMSPSGYSWSAVLIRKSEEVRKVFAISCLKRKG